MGLSISAYDNPNGYQSQIKLPEYNWDAITHVLQHKQAQFDQGVAQLNNLKSTALNINFINSERRGEVDQLNKDLQNKFSSLNGEYGDLSDAKTYNNYLSWFDGFSKNTDLIQAYHVDKQWQTENSKLEYSKNASNKFKSGYSPINEYVFKNKLNDYANSTKGNTPQFSPYTPYVNKIDEITQIYKSLPKKSWKQDITNKDGTITTIEKNGYTPDEWKEVIRTMTPELAEQFRVEAEYQQMIGLKTNANAYRAQLSNEYVNSFTQERSHLDDKTTQAKLKLAAATTPEEVSKYQNYLQNLEQQKTNLTLNARSKDWFMTTDKNNLLAVGTQLHTEKSISSLGDSLGSEPSMTVKPNLAWQFQQTYAYRSQKDERDFIAKEKQQNIANSFNLEDHKLERERFELEKLAAKGETASAVGGVGVGGDDFSKLAKTAPSSVLGNNEGLNAKIETFNKYDQQVNNKTFNITDGKNYGFPFEGSAMDNNTFLTKLVLSYDPSDNTKRSQFNDKIIKNGLGNNPSIEAAITFLPQIMEEARQKKVDMNTEQKIKWVQTRVNQIINNDPALKDNKFYDPDKIIEFSNTYHNNQVEWNHLDKIKGKAINETMNEIGVGHVLANLTSQQHDMVFQGMVTKVNDSQKDLLWYVKNYDFSGLGESSNKTNQAVWDQRANLAKNLEKHIPGVSIPPEVIRGVSINKQTGDLTYSFNSTDAFDKHNKDGSLNTNKFPGLKPNGMITVPAPELAKPFPIITYAMENGEEYRDKIIKNGVPVQLTISKLNNTYQYSLSDGSANMKLFTPTVDSTPEQVVEIIKSVIINSK